VEISKETLIELYINKNLSRYELSKILNISERQVVYLLSKYNIKKDIALAKECRKRAKLEKYGTTNYVNSEKAKQTKLEKYGTTNYVNSEKAKQTRLKKYGKFHPDEALAKQQNTNRANNSGTLAWNTYKAKQTRLEKYNDANYNNVTKAKQTRLDKNSGEYFSNDSISKILKNKAITCNIKYGNDSFNNIDKIHQTVLDRYGVDWYVEADNCRQSNHSPHTISKINRKFADLLHREGIETEFEFWLDNYSYDLHILNSNILIELNPTYTHNSTVGVMFRRSRKSSYS
jgi:hypothetical protein